MESLREFFGRRAGSLPQAKVDEIGTVPMQQLVQVTQPTESAIQPQPTGRGQRLSETLRPGRFPTAPPAGPVRQFPASMDDV
jgi:hypothetical protein